MVKEQQTQYVSPEVMIVEINAQKVLCGSDPNSTEQYEREDW